MPAVVDHRDPVDELSPELQDELAKLPGKWVAVTRTDLIAVTDSPQDAVRAAREAGYRPQDIILKHVLDASTSYFFQVVDPGSSEGGADLRHFVRVTAERSVSGYAPFIYVRVQMNGCQFDIQALIDSGADRTVLPLDLIVAQTGIEPNELIGAGKSVGIGGTQTMLCHPVHECSLSYRGTEFFQGPGVMMPGLDFALLGREDFFSRFVVRFLWHQDPPKFDIDLVT